MSLLPKAHCQFCPRTSIWTGEDSEDGYTDRLCYVKEDADKCEYYQGHKRHEHKKKKQREYNTTHRQKKNKEKTPKP